MQQCRKPEWLCWQGFWSAASGTTYQARAVVEDQMCTVGEAGLATAPRSAGVSTKLSCFGATIAILHNTSQMARFTVMSLIIVFAGSLWRSVSRLSGKDACASPSSSNTTSLCSLGLLHLFALACFPQRCWQTAAVNALQFQGRSSMHQLVLQYRCSKSRMIANNSCKEQV